MADTLPAGIYDGIAADRYHADTLTPEPSLSSSGARKLLATCPAQFWWDRNNPPAPSEAFRVGSAAHEWLLEGETWPARHFVLPEDHDGRTKVGKALVATVEADGLRVITAEQFETIKAMHAALVEHPFAMNAFTGGKAEQTVIWRDEEFGIWCRARPDYVRGDIVADYKSCASAHPDDLRRSIADYGYASQQAWYLDGLAAVGQSATTFVFIFQAKTPPYLIVPVVLDTTAVAWGRTLNRKAKATFARCLRTGEWPGYASDVLELGLPGWTEKQLQDRHAAGEFQTEEAA